MMQPLRSEVPSEIPFAVADALRATDVALTPGTITLPWWAVWCLAFWAFLGFSASVLSVWAMTSEHLSRRRRERRMIQQWTRDIEQQAVRDAQLVQRQTRTVDLRTWH